MGGEGTSLVVAVESTGWVHPVALAVGLRDRWRGLAALPGGVGLLLRTRSVHGRGLIDDCTVVWMEDDGRVLAVDDLPPRGLARGPGNACWALELPRTSPTPGVGATVMVRPMLER